MSKATLGPSRAYPPNFANTPLSLRGGKWDANFFELKGFLGLGILLEIADEFARLL